MTGFSAMQGSSQLGSGCGASRLPYMDPQHKAKERTAAP